MKLSVVGISRLRIPTITQTLPSPSFGILPFRPSKSCAGEGRFHVSYSIEEPAQIHSAVWVCIAHQAFGAGIKIWGLSVSDFQIVSLLLSPFQPFCCAMHSLNLDSLTLPHQAHFPSLRTWLRYCYSGKPPELPQVKFTSPSLVLSFRWADTHASVFIQPTNIKCHDVWGHFSVLGCRGECLPTERGGR